MFDDVGKNIKGYAKLMCYLGIGFSIILFFVSLKIDNDVFTPIGFLLAIAGIEISFVSSLAFYALGEIVDQLKEINENGKETHRLQKKSLPEEEQKNAEMSYFAARVAAPTKTSGGSWVCKKCGKENEINYQICKDCGTYR